MMATEPIPPDAPLGMGHVHQDLGLGDYHVHTDTGLGLGHVHPAQPAPTAETASVGMRLIRAERQRQIEVEGYGHQHDAEHGSTTLTHAAGHYRSARPEAWKYGSPPRSWPWEASAWKPRDPISNLVRAGALYLAAADLGNPYGKRNARECADIIDACHARLTLPGDPS